MKRETITPPSLASTGVWTKPADLTTFLYAVQSLEYCKIGHAKDPVTRIKGMMVDNPHHLRLIAVKVVPQFCIRVVELYAHMLLRERHHRGEWFKCSAKVAETAFNKAVRHVPALLTERQGLVHGLVQRGKEGLLDYGNQEVTNSEHTLGKGEVESSILSRSTI